MKIKFLKQFDFLENTFSCPFDNAIQQSLKHNYACFIR